MQVDLVLRNGRILCGHDFDPQPMIAVHHGVIVAVGADAHELSARRTIDLAGATVVPGFHDAHNHLAWFGMTLTELDLRPAAGVNSLLDLYDAVSRCAARLPPGSLVTGSGYDQTHFGGAHPTATELDRAAGDHRVILRHTSGHMSVVNSAMLDLLDLDAVPPGGDVMRDATGTPTGLLREQAQLLLRPLTHPTPTDDVVEAIGRASDVYVSEGITAVQEAGVGGGWIGRTPVEVAAYQRARDEGRLKIRVTLMPTIDMHHDVGAVPAHAGGHGLDLGMRTGFGDDRLRLGPVKIFADGSLVGHTAAMHEDYVGECQHGYFQTATADLHTQIQRAHAAGWQIATHAIGDRAVSEVIDAYAGALDLHPRHDHRHRIEHCGITSDADLARIAELGLVPVPQGRFIRDFGDGIMAALGPARAEHAYRQRSFLTAGIEIPGSSDRPVVPGAPLTGLADLIHRRTASGRSLAPGECLTPRQALRAYTYGSAYAAFMEHRVGTIEDGKLADLAVLSGDPLAVDDPADLQVLATMIGGEVVHDRGGFC